MKKIKTSLCLLALSISTANAGGFENARLDTSFMYDEGNLVSFGSVRKDFSVNGSAFGTTKSLIGDRSASNLSAKYQVNDKLSLGLTAYDSGAIHINYQGAGGTGAVGSLVSGAGPKVDLTSDSIAFLSKYALSENFSVTAGLRYDTFNVSNADIFQLQSGGTPSNISSESDIVPIIAIAFEKPEIGLRFELLNQAKSSVAMHTICTGAPCAIGNSTGGLADYLTLNFQTGIAANTLLFGSIHKGKWSASQLSVADTSPTTATSAFKDSTEYSLGLGRKFTDKVSGSISYNWEPEGSSTTTSLFTVNNGYKGVSLGVKYAVENFEIAAGYNYTKLGDITYTPLGGNTLTDNTVSAFGAKATIRF
jgi:long-subunit fatty acid transport protein